MWPLIEPPGRASIAPLSDGTASDKDEKSISACPESAIGAVPKKKRVQSCNRLRFGKHWVNREELSFSRFPCWEFCVSFRYFSPCWRRSFSLLNKPTAPKTAHTTRRQWIKKTAKRPHPSPPNPPPPSVTRIPDAELVPQPACIVCVDSAPVLGWRWSRSPRESHPPRPLRGVPAPLCLPPNWVAERRAPARTHEPQASATRVNPGALHVYHTPAFRPPCAALIISTYTLLVDRLGARNVREGSCGK